MTNHKKNILAVITLTALLVSLAVGVEFVKASSKTITVPDDYSTIQAAIAKASGGDTVFVRSGSYPGGIVIDKPISLRGEGANKTTIVGGATASDLGVTSVALRKTPETSFPAGRAFGVTDETTLAFNAQAESPKIQPANFIPPLTFAIIVNSNDVMISGFTIMGGDRAIYSSKGDGLRINQNSLGTCILGGSNNTVSNNSQIGLTIGGYHTMVVGNSGSLTARASNSIFLENALTYFESQNANFNTIVNNTLSGANMGMWIGSYGQTCSYNLFAGNKIENSGLWGILMGAGSHNIFFGNMVRNTGLGNDHDGYGLALGGNHLVAENNLFLHNIFANNSKNFGANWPVTGANSFDDGKEGNYWDDYFTKYPNASEVGQSGTGNIPYVLTENNVDMHPLLVQPEVTDKVPALPELWASLLSAPSPSPSDSISPSQSPPPSQSTTPTLSPSPSIPEFPVWIAVPLIFASAFLIICWRKGNRRWIEK
jgi:nitrous oxidase accessory protein